MEAPDFSPGSAAFRPREERNDKKQLPCALALDERSCDQATVDRQKSFVLVRMSVPGIGLGHRADPHHVIVDVGNRVIVIRSLECFRRQRYDCGCLHSPSVRRRLPLLGHFDLQPVWRLW